jgi:hypothetical protein
MPQMPVLMPAILKNVESGPLRHYVTPPPNTLSDLWIIMLIFAGVFEGTALAYPRAVSGRKGGGQRRGSRLVSSRIHGNDLVRVEDTGISIQDRVVQNVSNAESLVRNRMFILNTPFLQIAARMLSMRETSGKRRTVRGCQKSISTSIGLYGRIALLDFFRRRNVSLPGSAP